MTDRLQRSSRRNVPLDSNMRLQVEDLPTGRGGLGILQTSGGLAGRQVQDRTYYLGVIRSKVSELESEIQRLQREIDSFTEDNKQYFALSKVAEDLSEQIENIRNESDDYNMARMNSFCELTDVKKEIADLNAHNQQVESTIDEIYREKLRKEERIQQLERELSDETQKSERLLENMNSDLRQQYYKMKSTSNQLRTQMDSMQNEISSLEIRMNKMRVQMSGAVIKQEALSLVEQIYQLELKQEQISNESQNLLTSEQVTDDQSVDEDTKQEYNQLKTKEQHIDEFFSSYEQMREQYSTDIQNIQKSNVNLLELISQTLVKRGQSRTYDDYAQLKSNLDQHEVEKRRSNDTMTVLAEQHRKLKQDYTKLETLDQRLTDELQELKIKYTKMHEDLEKFNNLEGVKRQAEKRKQQLAPDKTNMTKQRQTMKTEIQTLQFQFEAVQTQLRDNETHRQLVGLEKQLQSSSQTLFALDEALTFQNALDQYEQIKRQALDLVQTHNRWLIQRLENLPFP